MRPITGPISGTCKKQKKGSGLLTKQGLVTTSGYGYSHPPALHWGHSQPKTDVAPPIDLGVSRCSPPNHSIWEPHPVIWSVIEKGSFPWHSMLQRVRYHPQRIFSPTLHFKEESEAGVSGGRRPRLPALWRQSSEDHSSGLHLFLLSLLSLHHGLVG